LTSEAEPQEATTAVVSNAAGHGAQDNASAVIVDIR
jgi:serine/threonine protein phosphatase PrpC